MENWQNLNRADIGKTLVLRRIMQNSQDLSSVKRGNHDQQRTLTSIQHLFTLNHEHVITSPCFRALTGMGGRFSTDKKTSEPRKLAEVSILIALGVVLSFFPGPIPIGPTYVFPFQSMINVIAGILLGPWYAAGAALGIGIIRIFFHTGTVFSLPGGIPGAILVGLTYRYTKSYLSAFAEIPGTVIFGALLSAFIVAPVFDISATLWFFIIAFVPPAVLGSSIGYIMMIALKRRGIVRRISH